MTEVTTEFPSQVCEIESRSSASLQLSLLSDRWDHPAQGMLGGHSGASTKIGFDDGRTPHPKSRTRIEPGQRLHLSYAGGGGVGDPLKRSRESVREDLKDGYISAAQARSTYGLDDE